MEALTACSVACLTIYDMCKSADRSMVIGDITLWEKTGGRSGVYRRDPTDLVGLGVDAHVTLGGRPWATTPCPRPTATTSATERPATNADGREVTGVTGSVARSVTSVVEM